MNLRRHKKSYLYYQRPWSSLDLLRYSSALKQSLLHSDLGQCVEFFLRNFAVTSHAFNTRVPKATCSNSIGFYSYVNWRLALEEHKGNRGCLDNVNPHFTKYQQRFGGKVFRVSQKPKEECPITRFNL